MTTRGGWLKLSEGTCLRILYFLVFCCTASWLPIFADYLKERKLDGIEIGIVLSITPLMMFLVQPFYGMLADRFGYRACFLVSSFLAACAYSLYLVDAGFAYLFMVTLFMSVFYNTLQPLLDSLSLSLAQRNSEFSYGTLRIAGAAGWAVTGTIVGHYIDAVNTTVIFVFSSGSMILAFLFALPLQQVKTPGQVSEVRARASNVFNNKSLLFLLGCVFFVSVGATTIWNFYSIYMKEIGASASLVGYGISFQGLCELPLFYFSARIIGRLGIKTALLVTIFATAIRLLLYSLMKNPVAALFIELIHGVSWSLFWVVCVETVNRLVNENWRATGQSLLYAAYFGVGQIAGNLWTGYLYSVNMKVGAIFFLNACLVVIVGVSVWLFFRTKSLTSTQPGVATKAN